MATHSSILAWRIPGTTEPGRLQSMSRKESDLTKRLTHNKELFVKCDRSIMVIFCKESLSLRNTYQCF